MMLRRVLFRCALALGALAWLPGAAHGAQEAVDCPAGTQRDCVCWRENGVLGMACSQLGVATENGRRRDESGTRGAKRKDRMQGGPATPEDDELRGAVTDDERRAALERRQERLNENLLKVQRARFLAQGQAEPDNAEVERLEKDFASVQEQRRTNLRQLEALGH